MSNITAIIPAYNEEISIGSVILNVNEYVDNIIVVDDGSNDKTSMIAELAGAEVIKHPENKGKGASLKTGFENVKNTDIIVTIDGDGQHNPDDIPRLIKPISEGSADIVNGSRYLNQEDNETPAYRRLGQTVLDKATSINSGLEITDSQSGFRAFGIHTLPAFRFSKTGFVIESEMLIDAAKMGLRVTEIPIGVRYQNLNGHKKNPISHGVGVLVSILQDMEFNRPLYYFTLPGIILIIIGLIYGFFSFGDYLGGNTLTLAPTVLGALVTLIGTFIAFTGFILDSISRMITRTIGK